MLALQGPTMAEAKFPTAFPLKHQRKDLELALDFAQSHKQDVPVASAVTDLFKKVLQPDLTTAVLC